MRNPFKKKAKPSVDPLFAAHGRSIKVVGVLHDSLDELEAVNQDYDKVHATADSMIEYHNQQVTQQVARQVSAKAAIEENTSIASQIRSVLG